MTNGPSGSLTALTLRSLVLLGGLVLLLASVCEVRADSKLLNVSYDPTRELFEEINQAFVAQQKAAGGETVSIRQSHGGSGKQARSVVDGLRADVVTLALAADIDQIAALTGKLPADWQSRLPHNSSPYTSVINFVVRKGNPKAISDWSDLARADVAVITPNPKTSGGARWNFLAAYAYGLKQHQGDAEKARAFVGTVYANAPVLDTGARASTTSFARRGLGDVLISWESESYLILQQFPGEFEIVYPSLSILTEPPVAVIDANAEAHQALDLANAYLQFLYTPTAQKIAAAHFFRPRNPSAAAAADLARFPALDLVTIDKDFGGWDAAQKTFFADGGIFDQIFKR